MSGERQHFCTPEVSPSSGTSACPQRAGGFNLTVDDDDDDELCQCASPPMTFKVCEMCYLFLSVFVSDRRKRRRPNCLQGVISGARHPTMFLADDNCPAVP